MDEIVRDGVELRSRMMAIANSLVSAKDTLSSCAAFVAVNDAEDFPRVHDDIHGLAP